MLPPMGRTGLMRQGQLLAAGSCCNLHQGYLLALENVLCNLLSCCMNSCIMSIRLIIDNRMNYGNRFITVNGLIIGNYVGCR